jgi:L-lactate dehydrogenase
MKIGIIGMGRVGCACALAAVGRGSSREIVIVDRTRKRATAMATDLRYGSPLCSKTTVVDGDYDDRADAGLVMITAGIDEKTGGATDRTIPKVDCAYSIRTLKLTVTSFRALRGTPRAVILVVTDPPIRSPILRAPAQGTTAC